MFHKILIPLDGSSTSEGALDFLNHLSAQDILLARVFPPPSDSKEVWLPLPQGAEAADERECVSYLEKLKTRLNSTLDIQLVAISGNPAEAILGLADSAKCDLILMTSHGRSGIRRFLLGSTAEKVTRYATCPVLLVGRQVALEPTDPFAQAKIENAQELVEGCL